MCRNSCQVKFSMPHLERSMESVPDVLNGFTGARSRPVREHARVVRFSNGQELLQRRLGGDVEGSETGRPVLVRGIRITLLAKSI